MRVYQWPRQESNLDLELRKLIYYPLYYEALHTGSYANRDANINARIVFSADLSIFFPHFD